MKEPLFKLVSGDNVFAKFWKETGHRSFEKPCNSELTCWGLKVKAYGTVNVYIFLFFAV